MAHLALYRMFRPKTLDDVVRQEHIVTVLKNQIESGRIGTTWDLLLLAMDTQLVLQDQLLQHEWIDMLHVF